MDKLQDHGQVTHCNVTATSPQRTSTPWLQEPDTTFDISYTIGFSNHLFHSPADRCVLVICLCNTLPMQFLSTEVNDTNDRSLTRFRIGLVSLLPRTNISALTGSPQSLETISLPNKTPMEMMVSTTYIRPREFIVLSPNIDVFCAKIQLPVIQQTFTFAGDHIVSEL